MNSPFLSLLCSSYFLCMLIRVTTPILFASMACLVAKKAGVRNITIEGTMLISALLGVVVSAAFQNVWLGVLAGALAGVAVALFLGYFHLILDTDIWMSGIAINRIAEGGTIFLMFVLTGDKGSTAALASLCVPDLSIPLIQDIPFVSDILSGHSFFTYLALLCVVFTYILLYRTPLGLRIRAVGEYSMAVESVGQKPSTIKLIALAISGLFSAFGGMFMSMSYASRFAKNMMAGRGFIGIAAESMGGGTPIGSAISAFVFGFFDALANLMQSFSFPTELVLMIPYLATLIGLVVYSIIRKASVEKKRKNANRKLHLQSE